MAVNRTRTDGGKRVSLGTFSIHGDKNGQRRITLSKRLGGFDFPTSRDAEVRIDVIEQDGEQDYLEVHPVGGEDV